MATKRRIGLESSSSRAALMDGVEAVLRDDGYAALSARSVAERAGLKHQLVYYYFPTMDDLLMATYRRHTDRVLARIEAASRESRPLHAIWHVYSNPIDARLNMEFLVMANHSDAIRAATIAIGEESRRVGLDRIARLLERTDLDKSVFGPLAVTMVIAAIGSIVGLESALGIAGGHAETRALVEHCLQELEPEGA
jgi:AcrR family transcriptional regulator